VANSRYVVESKIMADEKNKQEKPLPVQKFDWKKMISQKWVVRNIPFFLFLALLTVLYIYNGHYADRLVRKISITEKHITELEYEYKTIRSEVIYRSKASELMQAVAPLGLKELVTPPYVIGDTSYAGKGPAGPSRSDIPGN
jgi:hypothetical protein